MQALIDVILPVFLVIGAGYAASWRRLLPEDAFDGLMGFATTVAIPCLLFRAIWQLDLGAYFEPMLLVSYYTGAVLAFAAGLFAARVVFARDWEDAVAVGFTCLFSNSLLLGLPITERAYGAEALNGNYAIIAMHSPFCYAIGITAMEIARARGTEIRRLPVTVIRAMFRNALVIGILIGVAFNLGDLSLPAPVVQALDMISRSALPTALFALGGVLSRYRPEGDLRLILAVCAITLGLQPALTFLLGTGLGLPTGSLRSATVTAAMAPGINAFLFANMYGRAKRVAASSVLLATGFCVVTSWLWLHALP